MARHPTGSTWNLRIPTPDYRDDVLLFLLFSPAHARFRELVASCYDFSVRRLIRPRSGLPPDAFNRPAETAPNARALDAICAANCTLGNTVHVFLNEREQTNAINVHEAMQMVSSVEAFRHWTSP